MDLTWVDGLVFVLFMAAVTVISLRAARREQGAKDYFLAGRTLTWGLIGFSLIASNISTEHFVGMAGSAYGRVGMAIASYEWMAAVTLVIVALWLLPRFLAAGIYTMPEFLEHRYDPGTRMIMAVFLMIAYIVVFLATVLFSGAVALNAIFDLPSLLANQFDLTSEAAERWATVSSIWAIGLLAGAYTVYGGLKAVVWSDLIQGGALLLGGAIVTVLGLRLLGDGNPISGWQALVSESGDKLHVVLPWNDPDVPWVAVFVGGLWIPNLFYWGLNQFITQRTLGARSLAEGQKGIFLAAGLKLLIPFLIVIPGIMAYQLYGDQISKGDAAYPYLIGKILPPSLRGILFAALCGAVLSSFNSGLNSASTIFTLDLYAKFSSKDMTPASQVKVGRMATASIIVVACLWAPVISGFEGVFRYIQEIWGFISPGIVAVFLVGLTIDKAPPRAAKTAMLLGLPLYALCRVPKWIWDARNSASEPEGIFGVLYEFSSWAFLHHMMVIFLVLVGVMLFLTWRRPMRRPARIPVVNLDLSPHPRRNLYAGSILFFTALLYILFW